MTGISDFEVVLKVARHIGNEITAKAIRQLQAIKHANLSGDDSGLANTWEEICVQCQSEQSIFWDAYEATIQNILESLVTELPIPYRLAIWCASDGGIDWMESADNDGKSEPPISIEDCASWISEMVFEEAGSYSNERIEQFIYPE